jgi:hypothetical protein
MENEKFGKRIDLIVETMMARGLGFDFYNKKPKSIRDQKLLRVASSWYVLTIFSVFFLSSLTKLDSLTIAIALLLPVLLIHSWLKSLSEEYKNRVLKEITDLEIRPCDHYSHVFILKQLKVMEEVTATKKVEQGDELYGETNTLSILIDPKSCNILEVWVTGDRPRPQNFYLLRFDPLDSIISVNLYIDEKIIPDVTHFCYERESKYFLTPLKEIVRLGYKSQGYSYP